MGVPLNGGGVGVGVSGSGVVVAGGVSGSGVVVDGGVSGTAARHAHAAFAASSTAIGSLQAPKTHVPAAPTRSSMNPHRQL